MKNTRRGLGKGLGIGYKNLAPMDSHIHSLSAKGVKSQKMYYDLAPKYDSRASFYGKARIEDSYGTLKLFSYNTLVAEIEDGKVKVYGSYSQTTARHIKEFLKQNGFKVESTNQILEDYGVTKLNAKTISCKKCGMEFHTYDKNYPYVPQHTCLNDEELNAKGKPTDDQLRLMARLHPNFNDMIGKYLNQGMTEKQAVKKVEDLIIKKTREAESKGLLAKGKKSLYAKKTFKIGESAKGGVISVETSKTKATIIGRDWDFSKGSSRGSSQSNAPEWTRLTVDVNDSDAERKLQNFLEDITTPYYADNVMDFVKKNVTFNSRGW